MIRVAIAEDHPEMRVVLRLLLNLSSDLQLVCEAVNGQEAVDCVKNSRPDVLVMDIRMPILHGFEAVQQILALKVHTRVILISAYIGEHIVTKAAEVGAKGFVSKEDIAISLLPAIQAVHRGETFFAA